jgi:hypothetical protein
MSPYAGLLLLGAISTFILGLFCGSTVQGAGLIVFSGLCLVAEAITNLGEKAKAEKKTI